MPRPTKTPVSKRADLDARLKERDVKRANGRTRKHSRPPIRFLDIVAEEDLIAAMQGTYGIVTKIAANLEKKFRVPMNWSTVYEHITLNKNTHAAFLAEREKALDKAEINVLGDLDNGSIETSKWYLKHQGAKRGYVERQEVVFEGDPLNINLSGSTLTAEELASSSAVEVSGGGEKSAEAD